jgi:hypothetical protein
MLKVSISENFVGLMLGSIKKKEEEPKHSLLLNKY